MSSANFKTVKSYTKNFLRGFLFSFFYFAQVKVHAFEIDLSRRMPASAPTAVSSEQVKKPSPNLFGVSTNSVQTVTQPEFIKREDDAEILKELKKAVLPTEPSNEIVILNTETGFIPQKVQVRKGESYKIHIVNLNMREKNVSFLMDAFTQAHNTVFGIEKTFNIEPQVEGIFSYQCPETGIEGQMIVVQEPTESTRKPSSVHTSTTHEQQ